MGAGEGVDVRHRKVERLGPIHGPAAEIAHQLVVCGVKGLAEISQLRSLELLFYCIYFFSSVFILIFLFFLIASCVWITCYTEASFEKLFIDI